MHTIKNGFAADETVDPEVSNKPRTAVMNAAASVP